MKYVYRLNHTLVTILFFENISTRTVTVKTKNIVNSDVHVGLY